MKKYGAAQAARQARKQQVQGKRPFRASADDEAGFAAAEEISNRIRERHMPYGTIMDPVFASPDSNEIVSYTHTGDSAIWTGHYLAAESFRYRVTGSPAALENVEAAIAGIQGLIDITGTDVLSRVAVPADSPYAEAIQKEEGGHGVFNAQLHGRDHFWIGNTTRDQYSGVLFGLSVAFEMVRQAEVKRKVTDLAARLVRYLLKNSWVVKMPNGRISTIFLQRPEQQLAFLQIAAQTKPQEFGSIYRSYRLRLSAFTIAPIAYEVLDDHNSYFKFNLDTINLYSLIRLESARSLFRKIYIHTYNVLRRTTDDHRNAHFNMVDRAIKGASASRDRQTIEFLNSWLERPRRDPFVDLRGVFKACGDDRACEPIPIQQRPTTDFLWQRSPFLLFGGGAGLVEGAGIDFILPFWMARFYGVIA